MNELSQENAARILFGSATPSLEMRYLCYRSWEQIAVDMSYCIDNVYRLHRKALRLVEEVLESLQ